MGACGCGEFNAKYKIVGPDGITYSVGVYPVCDYCDHGAAVVIYRHSPRDAREWDVDDLPELPFNGYGIDPNDTDPAGEIVIDTFGREEFREGLTVHFKEAVALNEEDDEPFDDAWVEVVIEDFFEYQYQDIIRKSLERCGWIKSEVKEEPK